ncbi:MAG: phenylacetate-CoA oxygenase subunit PaaI, partial [Gemmatimonadetes bacterium]|nr:phenylacetate-CoA oxygenase subunit PaaI [Gemmatimonadota bacterium]
VPSPAELAAVSNGSAPHPATLRAAWDGDVNATLTAATLRRPVQRGYVSQGKFGLHSEHLSYLLAEMQCVARAHPEGVW